MAVDVRALTGPDPLQVEAQQVVGQARGDDDDEHPHRPATQQQAAAQQRDDLHSRREQAEAERGATDGDEHRERHQAHERGPLRRW